MKISILGTGSWGCTIAHLLSNRNHEIILWGRSSEKVQRLRCTRNHPEIEKKLHQELSFTSNMDEALSQADLVIEAVTIAGLRDVLSSLRRRNYNSSLIITSKGIEANSSLFATQIVEEVIGQQMSVPPAVLSGPTLSREVMQNQPSGAILSCKNLDYAAELAHLFASDIFYIFICADLIGTQLAGAFKNILAVGCGILDGMKYGSNTKAYLMTRGLHEMHCLALSLKCVPQTIFGLSGLGDLIATCLSPHSRNYKFGKYAGEKETLSLGMDEVDFTVEAINTSEGLLNLARKKHLKLPLLESISAVVKGKKQKNQLLEAIKSSSNGYKWN